VWKAGSIYKASISVGKVRTIFGGAGVLDTFAESPEPTPLTESGKRLASA
jgi:hypothetical protein